MEIDQELAKTLFEEGGVFIFLDVPKETEFGIDFQLWNTNENFRGIKMIPPGLHYIFYSSVSRTGDVAPRSGFFYNFRKGEVVVRKWDAKEEDLSDYKATEEEIASFRRNIRTMDNFLACYPFDIYAKWVSLTENISDKQITKLIPLSGIVRSALELQGCSDADRPRQENTSPVEVKKRKRSSTSCVDDTEDSLLPKMKIKGGTELRFTDFPEKHYPEGSTPSDITQHSLDSSYILECMICKYEPPSDIVGELEFCFICFLVGHSLEAFEQWRKLIHLFCSCESAITKYRRIYHMLLNVLKLHISEIPEEFLADIVSNNNFFYLEMRELFRNIGNSNADGELKSRANRFKEFLTEKFSWNFEHLDSEDEEDAPVIVSIDGY
ncbi:protein AAR2 homolog [Coccinella septempunctata]|uniref:protein AAR2 homolog n=1 Tax=Coccinella septempunctata TaxID=41139 RepID=UPI001D08647B|nr:protein AAR2 homolog [Coccinella septempunctata]